MKYGGPVIDAHIHLTEDGGWISDGCDASLERLVEEMEKSSVDIGLILALSELDQNEFIARVCEKSGGRFFALAGFNPRKDSLEKLRDFMEQKDIFKGVKLHPRMGNFSPNDEKLFPFYEEASEKGWVINFDAMAHTSQLPMEEIRPSAYDRLAKKFREMKMVLSHCGVPWVLEAFFAAKSNTNLYLDCSFIIDRYKGSSIYTDFLYLATHLDKKLIYGSDFPERSIIRYLSLARVSFSNLLEEKKSNILGRNAIQLFGLDER